MKAFLIQYFQKVYFNVDDLVLSFLVVLITVLVCDLAREILLFGGRFAFNLQNRIIVAETIGTMEACVICFELNIIITPVFSCFLYQLGSFIWFTWQSNRAPEYQYEANVLDLLVKHIKAKTSRRRHSRRSRHSSVANIQAEEIRNLYKRFDFVGLMIAAQILGAYLGYLFLIHAAWSNAKYWTMWKETNFHMKRYDTVNQWESSISKGTILAGLCEGFFSCGQHLWPVYINFRKSRGRSVILMTDIGRVVFTGIGCFFSGGYYNPILGVQVESHTITYSFFIVMMVYCVGPLIGLYLGLWIERIS